MEGRSGFHCDEADDGLPGVVDQCGITRILHSGSQAGARDAASPPTIRSDDEPFPDAAQLQMIDVRIYRQSVAQPGVVV